MERGQVSPQEGNAGDVEVLSQIELRGVYP